MRLPCGYNAQVKQFLRSGQTEDTQFFSASHPEARLFCTEAGVDPAGRVELRLIRVELASGESEVLLTSLLALLPTLRVPRPRHGAPSADAPQQTPDRPLTAT